jgi:hypothetical protein
MTDLPFQWLRSKPVVLKAVTFDGTETQALAILQWMDASAPGGAGGHFRAGVAGGPGAIFVPVPGGVWRINPGDWVIQCEGGAMLMAEAARVAEGYDLVAAPEVIPCRHH